MYRSRLASGAAGLLLFGLTGCSWVGIGSNSGPSSGGFLGIGGSDAPPVAPAFVAGDEPQAVEAGAAVLAADGSAADAATAMYFALSATLPVAAGLGGGGVCVVRDPATAQTAAFNFLSRASARGGDFGVPGNVRGFAALHSAYGRLPWQRDVAPGERMAATGFAISDALEERLRANQNAIRLDANLAAEFLDESGAVRPAGAQAVNPDLGSTLSAIREFGPDPFYRGRIARKLLAYSAGQGGTLSDDELAGYPVQRQVPAVAAIGDQTVYLPTPDTGTGRFTDALLARVVDQQGNITAGANPAATIAVATKATLDQFHVASLPRDMGATGFVALDKTGQGVACAVTLNGAFGSGHSATGTGVLLARTPAAPEAGLSGAFLSPAISVSKSDGSLTLIGSGAGGPNGTAALVYALLRVAAGQDILQPGDLHSTGLAPFNTINVIACQGATCSAMPDPAGHGLGARSQ
jgi:gamma-glutamyltranspeptidase/glutathione hydrolase